MLHETLKAYNLILGSGSPRRKQFFEAMGLPFQIKVMSVDEVYPAHLKGAEISDYLAALKAVPFKKELGSKDIVVTSDTVVWHNSTSLAKAATIAEATQMLTALSGDWHEVITSVCFTTVSTQVVKNCVTQVKFKALSLEEISFYIETYKPFDKAGAYGIQEWIGLIGIEEIKGSYASVVGLPTQLVYETLLELTDA